MGLSNRELATAILVLVFAATILLIPRMRRQVLPSIAALLKVLASVKILGLFAAYFAYAASLVVAAWVLGAWDVSLLKDTLIVVFFVGLPLLFNANEVKNGRHFITKTIKETIGVAALIAFYVGLVSLPLWAELIMQPVMAFFAMCGVVANQKKSTAKVGAVCNSVVGLGAVFLLVFTSVYVARHWSMQDLHYEAFSFATAVWLPVLLIPFVYVCAFVFHTESILVVLPFFNDRKPIRLRVKLALMTGLHLRTLYSSAFVGSWRGHVAETRTYRAARLVMHDFRTAVRESTEAEKQRLDRLTKFAGVSGTDKDGLRLDRREFGATKKALKDLYYMEMGWHRNRLGHYKEDLLSLFGEVIRGDLPPNHGIELKVSKDKQAWRAWRRTAGGWCFGVGGTRELDSQWEFDGPLPPDGYPRRNANDWIDSSLNPSSLEWSTNDDSVDWSV